MSTLFWVCWKVNKPEATEQEVHEADGGGHHRGRIHETQGRQVYEARGEQIYEANGVVPGELDVGRDVRRRDWYPSQRYHEVPGYQRDGNGRQGANPPACSIVDPHETMRSGRENQGQQCQGDGGFLWFG